MTVTINGTTGIDSPGGDVSVSQSLSGNLTFTGTGNRITGDFSNSTVANRVLFQSSTTNGITSVTAIPNGTATDARFAVNNNSDPTNSNGIQILANATEARIQATNFGTASAFPMTFYTGGSERVKIDTSGNLLVGTTSSVPGGISNQGNITVIPASGKNGINVATIGPATAIQFANTNFGETGNIAVGTSTTSYNTSSDYRLKENIVPMTGALAKVQQLKPVTYTWKADGSAGQGFIAHELQEVVPDCVTGEKDAVERLGNILDADGKVLQENVQEPTEDARIAGQSWVHIKDSPRYQGVDTSFLVATLVAAIQELKADFDAYKATHP
jgi:hypothetical protein